MALASLYLSSTAMETEGVPPPRAPIWSRAAGSRSEVPSTLSRYLTPHSPMKNPTRSSDSSSQRHIATLKVVSRLLGHEIKSQASGKAISMSRDEVLEIQTTIDLFIEQAIKGQKSSSSTAPAAEAQDTRMVGANN